ncbi:MAG: His/Gly/Thr/Pro-type tRNA ligase C-terminal domain-containing protein, partial [Myxococcota bacterium]
GKALQAGTSHFLGQNFAKAQDIMYLGEDGQRHHAWTTSWGVSTRLIGGLIMTHGDDDGMVMPPRLAPTHVVIMPITFKADDPGAVMAYCERLAADLRGQSYDGRPVEVEIDRRDLRGGEKQWQWIKRGCPLRVEVGPRDMAADSVFVGRRDKPAKVKSGVPRAAFVAGIASLLQEIQDGMLTKAKAYRDAKTRVVNGRDKFEKWFTPKNAEQPEIHGGFAWAHWNGDEAVAKKVQKELGVTIRCVPPREEVPEEASGEGKCIFTGEPSPQRVVWAKSY